MNQGLAPPDFRVYHDEHGTTLSLEGNWVGTRLGDIPERIDRDLAEPTPLRVDLSGLRRIDTAGAFALARVLADGRDLKVVGGKRPEFERLAELVRQGLEQPVVAPARKRSLSDLFAAIGRPVAAVAAEGYRGQIFAGRLVMAVGRVLRHPRRLRLTSLVAIMQQAGLAAVPIVVVMTFFIGAVLALVGSTMLQTLGVTIYAVELVGIGILREFGAVVAAILFSGRSASAFAAQIGSMRMNQELDAMQVMGVDIFEALVVPRVLAALIMLPLLTVVADLGGIVGGMLVSWTLLGIEPALFLQRMVDSVGAQQFWVGMAKVPLFALVIAATGCRQGLAVGSDVEGLGLRVTSAVVQSIFLIIMFDALFAVLFYRLDL
ncbi:ABC transporter permease [Sphingomonas sp. PL-96]|uniref:MlaE family ABC transporter permease n=1 Tax=Sphingomonas sp. PL-96 TaxID=2887201 RepID=UPI001E505304|nr:ABC transporter permease [Sphingomonas sp. PL-96]MCC2978032.1 ABC transporter permease [Sphingomonas sp. PL-96]